jgi:uncharacterized protein YrrD
MRVALGATVRTLDGDKVGTIDKLILDPQTHDVKAAAVRKGFLLTEDVEVPLDRLEAGADGEVRLTMTSQQVHDLPHFSEAAYTTPPSTYNAPPGPGYPVDSLLWPTGAAAYPMPFPPAWAPPSGLPPEVEEMRRQLDLENAVIDEGSDVYSSDGHKIGEVHSVTFDTASGHPSTIMVRKGFLFTEDFELPASLISSLDDGAIYLRVARDEIAHGARSAV